MNTHISRRQFVISTTAAVSLAVAQASADRSQDQAADPWFKISLAEWSLHRSIQEQKLTNLDFPRVAKQEFGIEAIEFVNQFFKDEVADSKYLNQLKLRCQDAGVTSLLIMVDNEGRLGDPDDAQRTKAIDNHRRWLEAAKFLGCHSIRVNAASDGSFDEQVKLAADGLTRLAELGNQYELSVIVENHGGLSSNGSWLAKVIKQVDKPNCGTLPDFGNFQIDGDQWYDRYKGVRELMPFAKAVSAKSHDFDENGNETKTDYLRMLAIVKEAGYRGYIGIEYEGSGKPEFDGIRATRDLLARCREKLS
jgi:sugar phosphate isomerase/epimerase